MLKDESFSEIKDYESPLSSVESENLKSKISDIWQLREFNKTTRLDAAFQVDSYEIGLEIVGAIAQLAIQEKLYPEIVFGKDYVIISLLTKKINGLHRNDFIMAAKIDEFIDIK